MAQLIQLRNRIKAIETIKKITHAMRLISMSSHTRMRSKEDTLREYLQTSRTLLSQLKQVCPTWQHPFFTPANGTQEHKLVILIGSQRGLCGNFNSILFHFFQASASREQATYIGIGKRAVSYLQNHNHPVALSLLDVSLPKLPEIAQQLTAYILASESPFTSVVVISNKLKTFFIQKPHATTIIPFAHPGEHVNTDLFAEEYIWEQEPADLLSALTEQTIQAQFHYLLYQSLVAEQAARFISMDNATRNAQHLLEATKLSYNKLRQAKITKELTELTGGF